MERVSAQAKSLLANKDRLNNLALISRGHRPIKGTAQEGDWYRISFHYGSIRSAWVQQAKIRKKWQELETRVVDRRLDLEFEWVAEIWVRRKVGLG